jgi:hypothetical protein
MRCVFEIRANGVASVPVAERAYTRSKGQPKTVCLPPTSLRNVR